MIELAHTDFGDGGRPLVILHGLFGSGRNWASIAKTLAETHRVYALDLRNHGASPRAATMTYTDMADDVAGFIESQGIEAPIVMGHSMGGKVAMQLALERPDVPAGLIVVDIAPVTYGHDMMDYIAAMQMLDLSGSMRRGELEEELRGEVEDPGITAFLMSNLERANGGFQWRINLTAIAAGMSGIAGFSPPAGATYGGPAAFIAGEHSAYIRDSHKAKIAELFPKARTVTIKDAAHWVHADQPKAFLKTVQAFLGAVG
jgi:esterase